jgi:hypothetical protein
LADPPPTSNKDSFLPLVDEQTQSMQKMGYLINGRTLPFYFLLFFGAKRFYKKKCAFEFVSPITFDAKWIRLFPFSYS